MEHIDWLKVKTSTQSAQLVYIQLVVFFLCKMHLLINRPNQNKEICAAAHAVDLTQGKQEFMVVLSGYVCYIL